MPTKSLEREFFERVPLPASACQYIRFRDPWAYLRVAEERYRLMRTHSWHDDVLQRLTEGKGRRRPFAR